MARCLSRITMGLRLLWQVGACSRRRSGAPAAPLRSSTCGRRSQRPLCLWRADARALHGGSDKRSGALLAGDTEGLLATPRSNQAPGSARTVHSRGRALSPACWVDDRPWRRAVAVGLCRTCRSSCGPRVALASNEHSTCFLTTTLRWRQLLCVRRTWLPMNSRGRLQHESTARASRSHHRFPQPADASLGLNSC